MAEGRFFVVASEREANKENIDPSASRAVAVTSKRQKRRRQEEEENLAYSSSFLRRENGAFGNGKSNGLAPRTTVLMMR